MNREPWPISAEAHEHITVRASHSSARNAGRRRPLLFHRHWSIVPAWAAREYRQALSQSAFRFLWSIIQPLATVGVYAVVFRQILDVQGGDLPYLSFVLAGLVPWRLTTGALAAFSCLNDNSSVIRKSYFPREIIPLAAIALSLIDVPIMALLLLIAAGAQGIELTWTLVFLPIVMVPFTFYVAALAVFGSAISVFLRDISLATNLLAQVLFFSSPIMFSLAEYPDSLSWIGTVSPLAVTAESIRDCILRQSVPDLGLLLVHLVVGFAAFVLSLAYVRAVEHRMVDIA